jgi:hypothetical protein
MAKPRTVPVVASISVGLNELASVLAQTARVVRLMRKRVDLLELEKIQLERRLSAKGRRK